MDDDRRPDWARSSPLVVALGVVIERHGFDLALRGQMRLLHHARDRGWDSLWGAQHFLPTMAMTQPVPFLARLAAEAGEMRVAGSACGGGRGAVRLELPAARIRLRGSPSASAYRSRVGSACDGQAC
jgi:hypothetical protein